MKHRSIYGLALIAGSLGMVVTMLFHPTGRDLLGQPDEAARRFEMITVLTHSLALASTPILVFGFLGLTRRLSDHALAWAAFVVYSFGAVAVLCAATLNGLVAPTLTRDILTDDGASRETLHLILDYNLLLNQAFAKVFVTASSFALTFWSILILRAGRFAKVVGLLGLVVGVVSLAALFSGHLRLNLHGFGLLIFAQAIWTFLLGVLMIRTTAFSKEE